MEDESTKNAAINSEIAVQVDRAPPVIADTLNPWLSIWLRPRETFRQVKRSRHIALILLALGGGLSATLAVSKITDFDRPISINNFVLITLASALFCALLQLYLWSSLCWLFSRRSTTASWREISTVFGWSYAPSIILLPFSLTVLLCLGPEQYLMALSINAPTHAILPKAFKCLQLFIVYPLTFVLQIIGLKEVLSCSFKRAFWTLVGISALLVVCALLLYTFAGYIQN